MRIYKSKIGLELIIPISALVIGIGGLMIYEESWFGLGIIMAVGLFIGHLCMTTYYKIDGPVIQIKSGFFSINH